MNSEIKEVVLLNGEIINIGTMKNMPDGAVIEQREMFYTEDHGWREVGWAPPKSEIEQIKEQNSELRGTIDFILTELIPSFFE